MTESVSSAFSLLGTAFTWMLSNPYFSAIIGLSVCAVLVGLLAGIFR